MEFLKRGLEDFLLEKINIDRHLPIQLDVTNLCNLRCVHCYHPHHKNEGAISLADWQQILLQYKALVERMKYRPAVVLCGGEPLASPYLMPLLEFVSKNLPSSTVSVLTNGTLITPPLLTKLGAYRNIRFQVSLDGPDAGRHDQIRGKGNFDKAMRGIALLKHHGFEVNVLSVLSKKSACWMEDFFVLAKREGFASMNFIRFVSEGYGRKRLDQSEDEPLLGVDLKRAYEELLRLMAKFQIRSRTHGPLFELLSPGLGRSGRFWESIVVDYQGFVIASSRSKLRLGSALKDGLEHIFLRHEIYRALRRGRIKGCGTCSLYSICGGDRNAAFAASGDFLGEDPGCWKNETKQCLTEAV